MIHIVSRAKGQGHIDLLYQKGFQPITQQRMSHWPSNFVGELVVASTDDPIDFGAQGQSSFHLVCKK
jgi:hypothetical protein